MDTQSLLDRLDNIGQSLEKSGHTLALLGLGSVGLELERLDHYSDLDFFVIAEKGYKASFIDSLQWLSQIQPIAYSFRNSKDGYKLLFMDGIFCEFAVFELEQLEDIPFAPGRIVWKRPEVPDTLGQPASAPAIPTRQSREWLLGETLTNLYIGLQRDRRGEKLSAMRFIQVYAVDRLLELIESIETGRGAPGDPFARERRFEQRYSDFASRLSTWAQGYEKNRESALAILDFLQKQFDVNESMAERIQNLCT